VRCWPPAAKTLARAREHDRLERHFRNFFSSIRYKGAQIEESDLRLRAAVPAVVSNPELFRRPCLHVGPVRAGKADRCWEKGITMKTKLCLSIGRARRRDATMPRRAAFPRLHVAPTAKTSRLVRSPRATADTGRSVNGVIDYDARARPRTTRACVSEKGNTATPLRAEWRIKGDAYTNPHVTIVNADRQRQ
jgi:hypothetical protein